MPEIVELKSFVLLQGYYGMGEVRAAIEVLKMAKQLNPSDKVSAFSLTVPGLFRL